MRANLLSDLFRQAKQFDAIDDAARDPFTSNPSLFKTLRDWLEACVAFGKLLPSESADRRALQGKVDYWTSRLLEMDHPIGDIDRLDAFDENAGLPLPDQDFPWSGLNAVTEKEAALFFGRNKQITDYAWYLEEHPALLIVSESGGGKSSLAMAGVIPELRRRHPEWIFTQRVTPGAHPYSELIAAFSTTLTISLPGDAKPTEIAGEVLSTLGSRQIVIFVDQMEELLTVCTSELEQADFCELLDELTRSGHARLLATMRSDHSDRFAHSPTCRSLYMVFSDAEAKRMLPPMTFEQIREVIRRPAESVGLTFIPASLIDRLANETANLPGGLPRLQFALQRLWELRPRDSRGMPLDVINQKTFNQLPNVNEALGRVAQGLYDGLSDQLKLACQRMMLELTVLDERIEVPLRRRCLESDVMKGLKKACPDVGEEDLVKLIQRFIDARLLVRTGSEDAAQLEVAHESLFRYWKQYQDWIQDDDARVRLKDLRRLTRDAFQWKAAGESNDYLMLKGAPLKRAVVYRDGNWLDELSTRYCDRCERANRRREYERKALYFGLALGIVGIVAVVGWTAYLRTQVDAIRSTIASLIVQLPPLEALDVAYTLETGKSGDFVAPLAIALDRLAGSEVLLDRKSGVDFSVSGQALLQKSADETKSARFQFLPIERGGTHWSAPVEISINEAEGGDGKVGLLDVGPPIPGMPQTRYVVMSHVNTSKGRFYGTFRKGVIYLIKAGAPPQRIATWDYPESTISVSEVAFDPSGLRMAIASNQTDTSNSQTSTLTMWNVDRVSGRLTPETVTVPGEANGTVKNRNVVTAVAFAGTSAAGGDAVPMLITGRMDGSVFCGEQLAPTADTSPVLSLRVAGPAPTFAALHKSFKLFVGLCNGRSQARQMLNLSSFGTLQSFALRQVAESHDASTEAVASRMQLSIVAGRKLCRFDWAPSRVPDAKAADACWAQGLQVNQAVPMDMDDATQQDAFLAIPDPSQFWVMPLSNGSPDPHRAHQKTGGVPVGVPPRVSLDTETAQNGDARPVDAASDATEPSQSDAQSVASSSNGKYRAKIDVTDGKYSVQRIQDGHIEPVSVLNPPLAISLNNAGTLVILQAARDVASLGPGQTEPHHVQIGLDASCLKLSSNGTLAVVAGGQDSKFETLNLKGNQPVRVPGSGNQQKKEYKGPPLTACAISDLGVVVLGYSDGSVVSTSPDGQTKTVLSQRAQFRMSSAVQDVSIDGTGHFVAAIGKFVSTACTAGAPGYPVRIWDLRRKSLAQTFPVASGCLMGDNVVALGPIANIDHTWRLPIFSTSSRGVLESSYVCQACLPDGKDDEWLSQKLLRDAARYKPVRLRPDQLEELYGITLPTLKDVWKAHYCNVYVMLHGPDSSGRNGTCN